MALAKMHHLPRWRSPRPARWSSLRGAGRAATACRRLTRAAGQGQALVCDRRPHVFGPSPLGAPWTGPPRVVRGPPRGGF